MIVERVRVEDGFLDGLDVEFAAGLNVLIGARGTGKTSLIELIRFALGARPFTEDAKRRGNQQAVSVLQGGRVTVTLRDGEGHFEATRGALDEATLSSRPIPPITVLAQSEIEAVGALNSGRLRLIDRFRPDREEADQRRNHLSTTLRSLTAEIGGVLDELRAIDEQILGMQTVRSERQVAVAQQQDLLKSIEATAHDRQELAELQTLVAALAVRGDVYQRTTATLSKYSKELLVIAAGLRRLEEWPESAGAIDLLGGVRKKSVEAAKALRTAVRTIESAGTEVQRLSEENKENRLTTEEKARASRRVLEELQAGAGELTRRVDNLTEQEAQLGALEHVAKDRAAKVEELQTRRRHVFEELEKVNSERFESRLQIANKLNRDLGPQINIEVIESGTTDGYANVIAATLRGSGLHYNTLAPLFATLMSPLELVEAVESDGFQAITEAVEITAERAMNVITFMRSRKLNDLIAASVDDAVELSLLDGVDYKQSDSLSIGQRCTVVLPVLLSGQGELLIVDQPEDHLDNAFITETLVERLRQRNEGDQFILASHNANIPVLGDADLVIRLGSDGRRGFVEHFGQLEAPETVRAITSVMEGGVEAFQRRALFYSGVLGEESG